MNHPAAKYRPRNKDVKLTYTQKAIFENVWSLEYQDQALLDKYCIFQLESWQFCNRPRQFVFEYNGEQYFIMKYKCELKQLEDSKRILISFRLNKFNQFAIALIKPVDELTGCPDYKHFPVGS